MKLSHKLIILLVIASCFVATPILYITYQNVTQTAIETEVDTFLRVQNFQFESITEAYLVKQEAEIASIMALKERLSEKTFDLRLSLENIEHNQELSVMQKGALIENLLKRTQKGVVLTFLFERVGSFKSTDKANAGDSGVYPLILQEYFKQNPQNMQNYTLKDFLEKKKILPRGEFSSFTFINTETGKKEEIFFFILPFMPSLEEKGRYLVSFVSVDDFLKQEQSALLDIVADVQENFNALSESSSFFIALVDEKNQVLASKGQIPDSVAYRNALSASRSGNQRRVVEIAIKSDYLIQAGYLKPLGWSIVMGVTLSALKEPGKELVKELLVYFFATFTLALLLSLLLLGRIVKPLGDLAKKVKLLGSLDFRFTDQLQEFNDSMPVYRKDEIGVLANNFKLLGTELSQQITNLVETTSSKERLQGELSAARDIQMDILNSPEFAPKNDGIWSAFYLEPAKEVGGDLYEYIELKDGRYAFIIGDVSGKGVASALFMSVTMTLLRYTLQVEENLSKAMENINNMLAKNNESNMFVTIFTVIYDPKSRQMEFVNGGHCQPYLINQKTKALRMLESLSGPVMGVFEDTSYPTFYDVLQEDELFLAFTDGVTEAMDAENALYSDERLKEFIVQNASLNPQEIIEALYASILDFRGDAEVSDDITLCSFR